MGAGKHMLNSKRPQAQQHGLLKKVLQKLTAADQLSYGRTDPYIKFYGSGGAKLENDGNVL